MLGARKAVVVGRKAALSPTASGVRAPPAYRAGRSSKSRLSAFERGGNDAVVAPGLEDQVVNLRRRDRAEGRQLGGRLLLVEHVERPVADGATPQMRVEESDPEV